MAISVRKFQIEDRGSVETLAQQDKKAANAFQDYVNKEFGQTGLPRSSGMPDTVLVALDGERIVGYLHFFTDHYHYHEKVVEGFVTDPAVPGVREALERAY